MKLTALVLLMIMPLSGCALFSPTPDAVKDAARYSVMFSQANESNITFLNDEWHRVLVAIIKRSDKSEEEKQADIQTADKLKKLIEERANPPAKMARELSEAISAYLDEPGIGLNRLLGLVKTATEASKKLN